MARYLLVSVDDNDRADVLRGRLDSVSGVKVVGLFGKPTNFCDGTCQAGDLNAKSLTGRKFGWRICPICKKAKKVFHYHNNLIAPDVPIRFWDCFLSIREPWDNDPVAKYGEEVIDQVRAATVEAGEKIARLRRRGARRRKKSA